MLKSDCFFHIVTISEINAITLMMKIMFMESITEKTKDIGKNL